MATSLELKTAIDRFVDETSVRANAIINGADNETVTIDSGVVPTFAKAIKDFLDTSLSRIVTLETLVESDDVDLDSIQEIVTALKALQTTLAAITPASIGAATAAQGLTADTAAQPEDLLTLTLLADASNVISGYPQTVIPDNWQNSQSDLLALHIGQGVTSIGTGAFFYCDGFTGSLTIPDSVTTIGANAFDTCSGFTGTLTILNSVTTIGEYAFSYCSGFTGSLTIPSLVTTISANAFGYCSGFTGSLTIPSSVTTIGGSAFKTCSAITSANIRTTLTVVNAGTDCLLGTDITTIHALASDGTWTAGSGLTIGGKTGITVIKDLT